MASDLDLDNEIQTTVEDTGLPFEYVEAVYQDDLEKGTGSKQTAGGDLPISPSAQGGGSGNGSASPVTEPVESGGEISEQLAGRAQAYGLDPTKFRDAGALQEQIDAFDRRLIASVRGGQQGSQQQVPSPPTQQELRQQLFEQQRAQQMAQPQVPAQQQPSDQQQGPQLPQFKFDLGDDDDYDPAVIDKLNAGLQQVADFYQPYMAYLQQLGQVVEQQQAYIQEQHYTAQAQQVEETNAAFDTAVDGLGHEAFGKGRYDQLLPTQQGERQKLMDVASALVTGYQQSGIPVPGIPDVVQQAFRLAFADEAKQANQAELRDRIKDRSQRRLGTGKSSNANSHVGANGKIKPYRGKDPAKDEVLLSEYNRLIAEQDFK